MTVSRGDRERLRWCWASWTKRPRGYRPALPAANISHPPFSLISNKTPHWQASGKHDNREISLEVSAIVQPVQSKLISKATIIIIFNLWSTITVSSHLVLWIETHLHDKRLGEIDFSQINFIHHWRDISPFSRICPETQKRADLEEWTVQFFRADANLRRFNANVFTLISSFKAFFWCKFFDGVCWS